MQLRTFIRLIILTTTVALITESNFAQTKKIDSLRLLLTHAKEDTNQVNILYKIGEEYWIGLTDTIDIPNTIKYTEAALSKAKKLDFKSGEFNGLMCLGNVYAYQYKLAESKKYFNDAIETAKQIGDKRKLAETYAEIADDYFFYGNNAVNSVEYFPASIDYYFKALKASEAINEKYQMAKIWFLIGRIYAWQNFFTMGNGNADEIENCANKALVLYKQCPQTNKADIISCDFLIGRANYFKGNYSTALTLFYKCLDYAKDSSVQNVIANDYLNIGRCYKGIADSAGERGNKIYADTMYEKALKYFNMGLDIYKGEKSDAFMALCYAYIGGIQIQRKEFREARNNLNNAILHTGKFNGGTYQEIYQSLAKLDSAEGNYKLALEHYNTYFAYREKNIHNDAISQSLNYKVKYEFEKREDSLKQKQLITETKLQAEKKQKYFYLAGLILLALLSLFIFLTFRNQKKINRLALETFAKQKAELELQMLRTQLNPHFIFNCISSIDGLIQNNERHNATNYLNKFAKLMRSVLENPGENTVPISKDIETLKLYLDLEQLRNEDKYATQLIISPEILNSNYPVPPLVIQPYVENAIKHGLKNKSGKDGILKIEISRQEDFIEYIISDNGVGRNTVKERVYNSQKSYGLQISAERIKLFNNEDISSVKFSDKFYNDIDMGTTVTVKLKIK